MPTIHSAGKVSYAVTDDDALWLNRAVQAEGRPYERVARTLVNGFARAKSLGMKAYPTLAAYVRAYAQPVNPRFMPGGDRFEANPEYHRKYVPARRAAATRTSFKPEVVEAVHQALYSPWVSDVTDYAAPTDKMAEGAIRKGYQRRSTDVPGQNTFWTREPGWPGYWVSDGSSTGDDGFTAIVVLGALAFGASFWAKGGK